MFIAAFTRSSSPLAICLSPEPDPSNPRHCILFLRVPSQYYPVYASSIQSRLFFSVFDAIMNEMAGMRNILEIGEVHTGFGWDGLGGRDNLEDLGVLKGCSRSGLRRHGLD
jgi:hypothetical protein